VIASLHAREPLEVEPARETRLRHPGETWGTPRSRLFKRKVLEDNDMRKVREEMEVIGERQVGDEIFTNTAISIR
jgi:hypothetical protein